MLTYSIFVKKGIKSLLELSLPTWKAIENEWSLSTLIIHLLDNMKNKYSHHYAIKYNRISDMYEDIVFESTHKNVSQMKFAIELWRFIAKWNLSDIEKQALFAWEYMFISHVIFSI